VVFSIAFMALTLVALYNINIDELVGERGRLLAQFRRRRIGTLVVKYFQLAGRACRASSHG